ncbi:MAG: hypothetical protein HDT13_04895 [Butyrivibrio sp.]|nr:hypothetical protein [Butyrivibrio sp.]
MQEFLRRIGPPIFFCILILCFEIYYHRKKDDRRRANAKQQFWDREAEANTVRRKDLTFLNYMNIPLDSLPMQDTGDDEITDYQDTVRKLSGKRILNLGGFTNTDLKMEYGAANLPELTEYDNNYTTLVNILAKWGARLIELELYDDAVTVLEYGISIKSDVSRNFYLLADEYRRRRQPDKIDTLIEAAEKLESIMQKPILQKLAEIRSYCE